MTKRTVILPTFDNDDRSLAAEIASCEFALLAISGGFTSYDAVGKWNDSAHPDGGTRTYSDASRVYFAILSDAQDAQLLAMLPGWCTLLRQLALYTDSSECAVRFIEPEPALEAAS